MVFNMHMEFCFQCGKYLKEKYLASRKMISFFMCENIKQHYFYSKTKKMHQCIKFILFWNDTTYFRRSFHHQEFKTVHTVTGICQTDTAVCLLASYAYTQSFS